MNVTGWVTITLWLAALPYSAPAQPKYDVTFAQLTDAHIFDDGWKQSTGDAMRQAANNRTALRWAIDEINREAASGSKIDFVVYTGDLGLQNVDFAGDAACGALPVRIEPGLPPFAQAAAVKEVADELNRLTVRRVFMVSGNNDILDEQVKDKRFECFMAELQRQVRPLAAPLLIEELRADQAVDVNGLRLVGLNTASFKKASNYKDCDAGNPSLAGCPKQQMESLQKLAAAGKPPLLVFAHEPDLIDPYFHKQNPGVHKSTWDIPADARSIWEREICGPDVIAVFAGHFHDANTNVYGSNTSTRDLAFTSCVAAKTWVTPPLALKNQELLMDKARGFSVVRLSSSRAPDVQVKWFDGTAALPVAAKTSAAGSDPSSDWFSRYGAAVVAVLLILALVGLLSVVRGTDSRAVIAAILFVILSVLVVWFCRSQLGISDSATIVALLVIPLLVYGIVSGRIKEFTAPGGWGAKFGEVARARVDYSSSRVNVGEAQTIAKGPLPHTMAKIQQIRSGKPVVLTMTIGATGFMPDFNKIAVHRALEALAPFPNFKFVVFMDQAEHVISYMPGWAALAATTQESMEGDSLVIAANQGEARSLQNSPGMLTATISSDTTNAEALKKMEELNVDAIPVVDAEHRMLGVVERERILSRMVQAAMTAAERN